MKVLLAFGEAILATAATYLMGALVLFGIGGDGSIPGLATARETKTAERLNTSIEFQPSAGAALVVVFTAVFYLIHRRRHRLRQDRLPGQ